MKKILAIVLILTMISVPVLADDVDYSSMSTDELIAMRNAITEEIDKRNASSSGVIGSGAYVVGKDIKAGIYNLRDPKPGAIWFWIYLYESEDAREKKEVLEETSLDPETGEIGTVNLKDGMVMVLDGSAVIESSNRSGPSNNNT